MIESTEDIIAILFFLIREDLENMGVISTRLRPIIRKYFPTAPYYLFDRLFIDKSLHLFNGQRKLTGPQHIVNTPLLVPDLYPYLCSKSIGVKEVRFMTTDLLRDMIYAYPHIWRHWTLAFEFVFFNRKSVDLLKQALNIPNVWTCSILKLHQNYYNHPGVYECDQFHVTSLQNQQEMDSLILYLHSIPPKRHGKLTVYVKDTDHYHLPFDRICESIFKAFASGTKPQPFRLIVEDTKWSIPRYHIQPTKLENLCTKEYLELQFSGINSNTGQQIYIIERKSSKK